MPNILYYIPELDQSYGGVRQYAAGLLNLMAQDTSNCYYVYHNVGDPLIEDIFQQYPSINRITYEDVPIIHRDTFSKKIRWIRYFLYKRLSIGTISGDNLPLDMLCKKFAIDIIHCPYQYLPSAKTVKIISTLHDVQELHFPDYFSGEERLRRANLHLEICRKADLVIVSYKHIKKDLVRFFQLQENKISVILISMKNLWFEKLTGNEKEFLEHEKFLFYPANTWKHKNHIRLLEAIVFVREKYHVNVRLVCSGHQTEFYQEIQEAVVKLGLQNQVSFVGVLSEEDLFACYQNAHAVVIPTIYEAGSFPLYESILLGRPVICSNVTSLPETIGAEEYTFDPMNVGSIGDLLYKVWNDEDFKKRNLTHIKERAISLESSDALPLLQNAYKLV